MTERDDSAIVRLLNQKVFFWVMCSGALVSVMLFVLAYQFPDPSPFRDAFKEVGVICAGIVVVSLIQLKVLDQFYQRQSREAISLDLANVQNRMVEEFRAVIPEVKTGTIKAIEDIRDRVTDATSFMLNGIDVLSGAKAAGIVNIFPTRYDKIAGKSVIETVQEDLPAESSQVRLMGISLGDYFLDRGVLHGNLIKLLEASVRNNKLPTIKALLVHPTSETLRERARWEAGNEYY